MIDWEFAIIGLREFVANILDVIKLELVAFHNGFQYCTQWD